MYTKKVYMKKTLLSLVALLSFSSVAQTLVLYSGNSSTDFINGGPYAFDKAKMTITDSLKSGAADKFYYITGATSSWYVGGVGTGSYGATGNPTISYSGKVESTNVDFSAYTKGGSVKMTVVFKSAAGSAWGKEIELTGADLAEKVFSTPLASFTKRNADYSFSTTPITDEDLATVSAFEFGVTYLSNSGVGTAEIEFDNFKLESATAVNDVLLTSTFSNETINVYNANGSKVATGKLSDINLEAGFYIVKSDSKTVKVMVK